MITKFDDFINEGVRDLMKPRPKEEVRKAMDNMPISRRFNYIKNNNLDIYSEDEIEELKKEYEKALNDVIERYNDKIGGLAKFYVEEFPTKQDYENELQESSGYDEEEENEEYESTGEDEFWVLHNEIGIELGEKIGEKSEYGICNVLTDDWIEFWNELVYVGW